MNAILRFLSSCGWDIGKPAFNATHPNAGSRGKRSAGLLPPLLQLNRWALLWGAEIGPTPQSSAKAAFERMRPGASATKINISAIVSVAISRDTNRLGVSPVTRRSSFCQVQCSLHAATPRRDCLRRLVSGDVSALKWLCHCCAGQLLACARHHLMLHHSKSYSGKGGLRHKAGIGPNPSKV